MLPASMPEDSFDAAVALALRGQRFAPPNLLIDLDAGRFSDASWAEPPCSAAKPDPREALLRMSFSPRECDVAMFLAEGHSNKEIAHRLSIQEVTVKVYASSIYRKLGVRNRTQAAARLLAQGIG